MNTDKTKDNFTKRRFSNVNEAVAYLQQQDEQKKMKKEAKRKFLLSKFQSEYSSNLISSGLAQQQLQRQQAAKRERAMGTVTSKAEQLEIWACSLNEVPFLHESERQRTQQTTPPDVAMTRAIADATKICSPDNVSNTVKHQIDVWRLID